MKPDFAAKLKLIETVPKNAPLPPKFDALLLIDVQDYFCNPKFPRGSEEAEGVAERLASLVPEFRKAGTPVYAIYFDDAWSPNGPSFHKYEPAETDILVSKSRQSAFAGSSIKKLLKEAGHKNLLVAGFNTSACVMDTVVDGLKEGFGFWIMADCVANDRTETYCMGNGEKEIGEMCEKGAGVLSSSDALAAVTPTAEAPASARERGVRIFGAALPLPGFMAA